MDPSAPAGIAAIDAHGPQDVVGHRTQQLLFVGEVPVQGAGADVEFAREAPHGQVGDAVVVEDRRRRIHHVGFVELHTVTLT